MQISCMYKTPPSHLDAACHPLPSRPVEKKIPLLAEMLIFRLQILSSLSFSALHLVVSFSFAPLLFLRLPVVKLDFPTSSLAAACVSPHAKVRLRSDFWHLLCSLVLLASLSVAPLYYTCECLKKFRNWLGYLLCGGADIDTPK